MNKYILCAVLALIAGQVFAAANQPKSQLTEAEVKSALAKFEEFRVARDTIMTPEQQKEYSAKKEAFLKRADTPEHTYLSLPRRDLVPHRM